MKNKRIFLTITMILSLLFVPACDNNIDGYKHREYSINVDYIGTESILSECVKNITVYSSVEEYVTSGTHSKVLWVACDVYDLEAEMLKTFLDENDTVIVLSDASKADIVNAVTGEDMITAEAQQEGCFPLGVMFTNVTGTDDKDAVGLFTQNSELGANTDFLAFCSEYDYRSRYQDKNMITEYQKTQKLSDTFNAYNLKEKAYAVSYMTIVDFTENPTINANKTKYMYTLWSYTDVISINNSVSAFESVVDTGKDSYVVSYSPDTDREFAKGEDVSANFFYGRYYKTSFQTPSEGLITSLYKGYGDVKSGWRIALTKGKNNDENFVRGSVNLTGTADIISLTGLYAPSYSVKICSVDNFYNARQELSFGYALSMQSERYEGLK